MREMLLASDSESFDFKSPT